MLRLLKSRVPRGKDRQITMRFSLIFKFQAAQTIGFTLRCFFVRDFKANKVGRLYFISDSSEKAKTVHGVILHPLPQVILALFKRASVFPTSLLPPPLPY